MFCFLRSGFLCLALFAGFGNLWAAGNPKDSLEIELRTATAEEKPEILTALVKRYYRKDNPKALNFGREALVASLAIQDSIGYAQACNNLGLAHYAGSDLDSSEFYHRRSMEIRKRYGDDKGVAASLNNLGIIAKRRGDYPAAIRSYDESFAIKKECEDSLGMAKALNNMGLVYQRIGRLEMALEKGLASLRIKEALKDTAGLVATLSNIGLIFQEMEEGDQALSHFKRSLSFCKTHGSPMQDAAIRNNIGQIYILMDSSRKAKSYLDQSLKTRRKLGDRFGLAYTLMNMGDFHASQMNFTGAKKSFSEGIEILKALGENELRAEMYFHLATMHFQKGEHALVVETIQNNALHVTGASEVTAQRSSCSLLAESFQALGEMDSAFKYMQLSGELGDSLAFVKEKIQLTDIHLSYIADKQKEQIESLKEANEAERAEKEEARTIRNILGGAIAFALLILGALFWQSRLLKSANQNLNQKNALVEQQNQTLLETNSALEKSRIRAEAASKTKSTFLANMSHEIRTPLNGIMGLTSILENTPLNPQQKKYTRTIASSGEDLLAILNDILDFSRVEAGKLVIEEKPVDLRELAVGTVALLRSLADSKGITLLADVDENLPPLLKVDATRVRQVLVNLVNNSIKFTEKGQVAVKLKNLGEKEGKARVLFEVNDTGRGIPADQLPHIFDSFKQVDGSQTRAQGGVGLGLSICQSLVELMGGTIKVASQAGKGSQFSFELGLEVLSPPQGAEGTKPENHLVFDNTLASRIPLRVLVADDNDVNQMILDRMLRNWGYDPTVVGNGLEAVDAEKANGFDLIFMDIQMPVMDGLEATDQIKKLHVQGEAPPVIAVTANAISGQAEDYLAKGMDDYLGKPFKVIDLEALIVKWGKRTS